MLVSIDKCVSFVAEAQKFFFDRARREVVACPFTQAANSLSKGAFVRSMISVPHFLTDELEGFSRFLGGPIADTQKGMQKAKDNRDLGE